MLVTSNSRTPFLGLPEGNCDFLKEITLFRYSPFLFLFLFFQIGYDSVAKAYIFCFGSNHISAK